MLNKSLQQRALDYYSYATSEGFAEEKEEAWKTQNYGWKSFLSAAFVARKFGLGKRKQQLAIEKGIEYLVDSFDTERKMVSNAGGCFNPNDNNLTITERMAIFEYTMELPRKYYRRLRFYLGFFWPILSKETKAKYSDEKEWNRFLPDGVDFRDYPRKPKKTKREKKYIPRELRRGILKELKK